MEEKNNTKGISFLGLLGLMLVGFKIAGVITWSWWWVLLPFYGGLGLLIVILLLVGIISMLK